MKTYYAVTSTSGKSCDIVAITDNKERAENIKKLYDSNCLGVYHVEELYDGGEIDTVMMCQPMRTCLIVEMYDEVEVDGLYDMSWQSDSRLVVREEVHAEPYIDLSYRDLFPEGVKLV